MKKPIYILLLLLIIISGCVKNEKGEIYDDLDKMVAEGDSYSFENHHINIDDEHINIEFKRFYGSHTLWYIEASKDSYLDIEYNLVLNKGRFKAILIDPQNRITIIVDKESSEKIRININEGNYRIKVIGDNASGEFDIIVIGGNGVIMDDKKSEIND